MANLTNKKMYLVLTEQLASGTMSGIKNKESGISHIQSKMCNGNAIILMAARFVTLFQFANYLTKADT